ncbi:EAL domain-containing protein [Sulfurimonas sp. HSL-1716]|uniref:EAL domain-containing protein n=1 Tax=Hydrocurvibacter sulfurireducens TaxID=3131937 RepID=UPI0031F79F9F
MAEDLKKKIKILERRLKLSQEALSQFDAIKKKYETARENLQKLNASLEERVEERTKKIKEQHEYLRAVIDGVDYPIMMIKRDFSVEIMNSVLEKSIDQSMVADKENPKCYEISHRRSTPCDGKEHPCPLKEVIKTNKFTTVVHQHCGLSGNKYYVELAASPLFDSEKKCIGIIESARDITEYLEVQDELREQKSILQHQAHHDFLTGLPNRVLFNDRLNQLIEKGKRNKESFALFFIDLDRFKKINDSLGHRIGDEVLKTISLRIKSAIRAEDTLCRLGGDEFTILMSGIKKPQDASLLSQKILNVLSKPLYVDEYTFYISGSIGISLFPQDSDDPHDLLKFADAAMYKAKDEGRSTFQFYSAKMTDMALEHVALDTSLRQALENNEFVIYYQPQMNAKTDKIVGIEALVRWQHPKNGLIFPDIFLPIAEETGLIVEIDRWVMKTAMKQMVQWHDDGLAPGILALNLSMKQIEQKDFIDFLKMTLEQTKCKAQWIELEITESQIMQNPEESIRVLQQISDMGIELAVDDFGTGHSSLSYLKRLPIDKLKIDKSFIKDLPHNEEDVSITRAIIGLAKGLNLKLIAEGVEDNEQKEFLIKEDCDSIQGYLYSKPVSAEDIKRSFLQ